MYFLLVTTKNTLFGGPSPLRNLMVSDQDWQDIVLATKAQSNCQAWFQRRRVRIAAFQSKRALIKPSTSPTKVVKKILHYNN